MELLSRYPQAYLGTSEVIVTIMMNYIVYVEMPLFMPFLRYYAKVRIQLDCVSANATYQTPWL